MKPLSSVSENNGIKILTPQDRMIYSVGISTGGAAEIRMARDHSERRIIATTIDREGAELARKQISELGLSPQIKIKIEDVAQNLPYTQNYFDFIYARLVLHYLPGPSLQNALKELHRVLKDGGKIFVVVRSVECAEARDNNTAFDGESGLTIYLSNGQSYSRYFHSEESIQSYLTFAGFTIKHVDSYKEQLCTDFQRMNPSAHIDSLIEVLAIR